MQKTIFLLIALTLFFSGCKENNDKEQTADTMEIILPDFAINRDTAAANERLKLIEKELDYYLKRHSVDDEGYSMVADYHALGDSILESYVPKVNGGLLGMLRLKDIQRQGMGICKDTLGRSYFGLWQADTLNIGIRIDSAGVYAGQFNRKMLAEGHGCYRALDGSFYEGHWKENQRDGFGFMVSLKNIQAGTWKNSRFYGERIRHTSDRIYGIDISRYQHEKGRKRFSINWNDLRVTHLGRRIKNNITGEVDYPVRYVYIKSTQGTTIRNRYFVYDYTAARKRRIPVGAYHFFSTVRKGKEQATYFLNNTLFKNGDLPPVLDVEPSNKQIAKMGGTEVLLREMRIWIDAVEKRLHVRPILYVNQSFIFEHLVQAPDLMENYLIWIARYGEYRPGVHLAIWQLSSDSKVKGIQTDVDVNVFNGYEPQWEEFLKEETIKR